MLNCLQNFGMGGVGMIAWMLFQWALLLGVIYLTKINRSQPCLAGSY
ncbi:hypothetical protein PP175_02160 [Aneurinibacillus sp. Ricciae_BoGa-3]|nr:hypothetical protein [Aneurinibacillus sp. Ricciae_BoGa-3]WCK54842.1 hypothetical protein PP175_02160 [Aneurinibacillus sp. Ricciae_BoGa-3]